MFSVHEDISVFDIVMEYVFQNVLKHDIFTHTDLLETINYNVKR